MIKIVVYKITPQFENGDTLLYSNFNNGNNWLRDAINKVYNHNKQELNQLKITSNLFHNHDELKGITICRYPLVQYQKKNGEYFVTGINEGCSALSELFSSQKSEICITNKLKITITKYFTSELQTIETNSSFRYRINDWLPLSTYNYRQFIQLNTIQDKVALLEQCIKIHLLKDFAHYLNLIFNNDLMIRISGIDSFYRKPVRLRVNNYNDDFQIFQPFTVEFTGNIILPQHICLGNGKVYGYGLTELAP